MNLPLPRRPRRCTILVAALFLLGTSCGINLDGQARVVPGASEELQRPPNANPDAAASGLFKVLLYFTGPDDNFYAVQQSFTDAPTVNDILEGIASNPVGLEDLERDIDNGAAPQELELIKTSLTDQMDPKGGIFDPATGELTVTVSAEANLTEFSPERRTTVFTQIVCTLTHEDLEIEIKSVKIFEVDGEEERQIFAQDARGAPNDGPSKRSDYSCEDARVLAEPAIESDTQTKRALELEESKG